MQGQRFLKTNARLQINQLRSQIICIKMARSHYHFTRDETTKILAQSEIIGSSFWGPLFTFPVMHRDCESNILLFKSTVKAALPHPYLPNELSTPIYKIIYFNGRKCHGDVSEVKKTGGYLMSRKSRSESRDFGT